MLVVPLLLAGLAALACAGTAAPTAAPGPAPTPAPAERSAILSELRNDVEARAGAAADWSTASEGQQLAVGAGAKTGADSRVRIDISDGSLLRIAPNSLFELSELSPTAEDALTRLLLEAGLVFVQVTHALGSGAFEIETPAGVAGVRGSLMSVAYDPVTRQMTVTCLEGLCRLTGGAGFTDLTPGEQSSIVSGEPAPAPAAPMDPSQREAWALEFPEAASALAALPAAATPTPSPTPTASPSPTASPAPAPVAESACDHPYLPLRLGAAWLYAPTLGEGPDTITVTVTSVQGDGQAATADTSEYAYQCDSQGLIYVGLRLPVGIITHLSGVFLPPADALAPGYVWTYAYYSTYAAPPSGLITTTVYLTNTVVNTDPVTFNGQSYPGVELSVEAVSVTEASGVFPVLTQTEYAFTRVLARGVGLVEDLNRRLKDFSIP
jgi:hypothetical protein